MKYLILPFLFYLIHLNGLQGQVNPQNGNFHISYADIRNIDYDDFVLAMERNYNSKSNFNGPFGYGWNNFYFYFAIPLPSGTIVTSQGGMNIFHWPENLSNDDLQLEVDIIASAYASIGRLVTPSQIKQFKNRLLNDHRLRYNTWVRLLKEKKVDPVQLPIGHSAYSKFCTSCRDIRIIKVTENGFESYSPGSRGKMLLDKEGKYVSGMVLFNDTLTRQNIDYNKLGHLYRIRRLSGKQSFRIRTNSQGKIVKIWDDRGHEARYNYNHRGDLIKVLNENNIEWKYNYDEYHNLNRILYPDGLIREMTYFPKTLGIQDILDPDGDRYYFRYDRNLENPDRDYNTSIFRLTALGDTLGRVQLSYLEKIDTSTGSKYLAQFKYIEGIDTVRFKYSPEWLESLHLNGDSIYCHYNFDGKLIKVEDEAGEDFFIDFNKKGRIQYLTFSNNESYDLEHFFSDSLRRYILTPSKEIMSFPVENGLRQNEKVHYQRINRAISILDYTGDMGRESYGYDLSGINYKPCGLCLIDSLLQEKSDFDLYRYARYLGYYEAAKIKNNPDYKKELYRSAAILLERLIEKRYQDQIPRDLLKEFFEYLLYGQAYDKALHWIEVLKRRDIDNSWAMRYEPLVLLLNGNHGKAKKLYKLNGHKSFGAGIHHNAGYAKNLFKELYLFDMELYKSASGQEEVITNAQAWIKEAEDLAFEHVLKGQIEHDKLVRDSLFKVAVKHFSNAYNQNPETYLLHNLLKYKSLYGEADPEESISYSPSADNFRTIADFYWEKGLDAESWQDSLLYFKKSRPYLDRALAEEWSGKEQHRLWQIKEALNETVDISTWSEQEISAADLLYLGWALLNTIKQDSIQDRTLHELLHRLSQNFKEINDVDTLKEISQGLLSQYMAHHNEKTIKYQEAMEWRVKAEERIFGLDQSVSNGTQLLSRITDLGGLYHSNGHYEKALRAAGNAVEKARFMEKSVSPEFRPWLAGRLGNYAAYSVFNKLPQQAVEAAKESLSLSNGQGWANTSLIRGYLLGGQYDKAVAHYESIKNTRPASNSRESFADGLIRQLAAMEKAGIFDASHPEIKRFRAHLGGQN